MKPEFSRQIFQKKKKARKPNLMKIRPLGAELLHADEQTDMTKPKVAFRNFANATKKRGGVATLSRPVVAAHCRTLLTRFNITKLRSAKEKQICTASLKLCSTGQASNAC
jgi:hypothetical protein